MSYRSGKESGRRSESPLWRHQWRSFVFISHADDVKREIRLHISRLLTNQKRESARSMGQNIIYLRDIIFLPRTPNKGLFWIIMYLSSQIVWLYIMSVIGVLSSCNSDQHWSVSSWNMLSLFFALCIDGHIPWNWTAEHILYHSKLIYKIASSKRKLGCASAMLLL